MSIRSFVKYLPELRASKRTASARSVSTGRCRGRCLFLEQIDKFLHFTNLDKLELFVLLDI